MGRKAVTSTVMVWDSEECNVINYVAVPNRLWLSAVATDLGHPYWIYIIPTHGMHQWLLLQFLVLLMMDAEIVRIM